MLTGLRFTMTALGGKQKDIGTVLLVPNGGMKIDVTLPGFKEDLEHGVLGMDRKTYTPKDGERFLRAALYQYSGSYIQAHAITTNRTPRYAGGPGSGNFGHSGRPGEVGGSSGGEGAGAWHSPGGQGHTGVTWTQPTDPRTGRPIPIKVDTVEEAVDLVSQGKVVEVKDVKAAHTLISKLADMAQEAKANKGKEIDYDLCQISVAGTNMFCAESLRETSVGGKQYPHGVPRLDMPQLAGLPEPGSEADKLPKNDKGEVDASEHFIHFLQGIGMKTTHEEVPAEVLRASQRELVGQNVGGMMRNAEFDPAADPIFVSSDNYVVDGHHRWAATVGRDAEDGHLGDSKMKIRRINAPISEVLHLANEYSKRFGIKQKGVGAGARHK